MNSPCARARAELEVETWPLVSRKTTLMRGSFFAEAAEDFVDVRLFGGVVGDQSSQLG